MTTIKQKVQAQFGKTAKSYIHSQGHAEGQDLQWMLEQAGGVKEKKVLDIATGGGHTAIQFAKAGADVIATDLTPEMLQEAKKFALQQGFNIEFQFAEAENLPFEDACFDIVTCRIAPHHFADPQKFVKEAYRVLKPSGQFLLIDNIAPESVELAKWMNEIEKRRDDSHVEAYTVATWIQWMAEMGFDLQYFARWFRSKNFQTWADRAQMPLKEKEKLETTILNLPKDFQTYFKVEIEDGRLKEFVHEVGLFVGIKF
ncbi:MAG: methyltransferase domain-containing protein [Chitinophagales bacterium]